MGQHRGHLIGAHHTGVAAEDVDMPVRHVQAAQHLVDLHNGQAVVVGGFVKADAAFRARAVVPQDHDHPVGGILFQAVFQELLQAFRAAHGLAAPVFRLVRFALEGKQVTGVSLQQIQGPFLRAAGQHDDIHVIRGIRVRHLDQVLAGVFLQVGAAHIDQQGGGFRLGQRAAQAQRQHERQRADDSFHISTALSDAVWCRT